MRYLEAGATVQVHDLTYGERCEAPALWQADPNRDVNEVKQIRKQEIESAAEIMGVSVSCFDWGDSPLILDQERLEALIQAIRAFRPDVVFTHWKDDVMHPDHVETTRGVIWACSYCSAGGIKTEDPRVRDHASSATRRRSARRPWPDSYPNFTSTSATYSNARPRQWPSSRPSSICRETYDVCWAGIAPLKRNPQRGWRAARTRRIRANWHTANQLTDSSNRQTLSAVPPKIADCVVRCGQLSEILKRHTQAVVVAFSATDRRIVAAPHHPVGAEGLEGHIGNRGNGVEGERDFTYFAEAGEFNRQVRPFSQFECLRYRHTVLLRPTRRPRGVRSRFPDRGRCPELL